MHHVLSRARQRVCNSACWYSCPFCLPTCAPISRLHEGPVRPVEPLSRKAHTPSPQPGTQRRTPPLDRLRALQQNPPPSHDGSNARATLAATSSALAGQSSFVRSLWYPRHAGGHAEHSSHVRRRSSASTSNVARTTAVSAAVECGPTVRSIHHRTIGRSHRWLEFQTRQRRHWQR